MRVHRRVDVICAPKRAGFDFDGRFLTQECFLLGFHSNDALAEFGAGMGRREPQN